MSTVTEHRKRAARATAADGQGAPDSQDNPEQPGEPTYRYLSDWQRDATCQTCGTAFEQLNRGIWNKATEALPPRPGRFADSWLPSECPTCEANRRAEDELRQSDAYLSDELPERITITFEPDEAVLVLDSMEELSEAVLANLRAAGKLSIAIGSPLQNLRTALGEEHFTRLLEAGKIISTEGSN